MIETQGNENKKNGWFVAAGILSIICAVGCFIGAIAFILSMVAVMTVPLVDSTTGQTIVLENKALLIGIMVVVSLFLIACIGLSIYCGKRCLDFAGMKNEELKAQSGKVITIFVLLFLFCGILPGVLAMVGYFIDNNQSSILIEPTSEIDEQRRSLEEAKKLYDDGIINEEEYQKMRTSIIEKFMK